MIIVFQHEDFPGPYLSKFYENLLSFMMLEFKVSISKEGEIVINGRVVPTTYSVGDGTKQYSKEEALKDYSESEHFKSIAKAFFWSVYKVKKEI